MSLLVRWTSTVRDAATSGDIPHTAVGTRRNLYGNSKSRNQLVANDVRFGMRSREVAGPPRRVAPGWFCGDRFRGFHECRFARHGAARRGRSGTRSGLMAVPRTFEWATQRFAAARSFTLVSVSPPAPAAADGALDFRASRYVIARR